MVEPDQLSDHGIQCGVLSQQAERALYLFSHIGRPEVKKCLVVGGVRAASGYGRVIRALGGALQSIGHVAYIDVGPDAGVSPPGQVLSSPYRNDFASYRFVPQVIREWAPDVVLIVHDLAYCAALVGEVSSVTGACHVVTYCPFEGRLAQPDVAGALLRADTVVLYSLDDIRLLCETWTASARARVCNLARPRIAAIPHGVDSASFRPLVAGPRGKVGAAGRDTARRRLLGDAASSQISFLVLNANTNIWRKRIDATLRVFAEFAADKDPGVKLLLKSSGPARDGCDIGAAVHALGLEGRVLLTESFGIPKTVDDDTLNCLYNTADVGMNTSEGEGWGLIAYEQAACGVPQILPAHPTAKEYWTGYPGLIGVSDTGIDRGGMFCAAEINEPAARDVLERLYRDETFREQAGSRAMEIATRPDLAWSAVGDIWKALVDPAGRHMGHARTVGHGENGSPLT
jgi:hypothetical protein